jgi:hypothetical protein
MSILDDDELKQQLVIEEKLSRCNQTLDQSGDSLFEPS